VRKEMVHFGKMFTRMSNIFFFIFYFIYFTIRGSAMSYKIENLKANNQYEFRIQYKSNINGIERSDWSPILQTGTTPEPMTGETIFKAIIVPGKDQLEKLLQILYVLKFTKNIEHLFFLS
jgi:hypothetical protein